MTDQFVLDISSKTIWVLLQLAAPPLLAAVTTGLIVSIFQAATQINEQTLSFIPKILVMTLAMIVAGPWMMQTIIGFTTKLMQDIPAIVGQ